MIKRWKKEIDNRYFLSDQYYLFVNPDNNLFSAR